MNWKKALKRSLVVLAGVGLAVSIVQAYAAPSPMLPREKDVRTAQRALQPAGTEEQSPIPVGDYVGGNGVVEPIERETKVAAQVGGRVARVAVSEGDFVEAGALLVELDSAARAAELAAAEGDLKAAEADLARTLRGSRAEDVEASVAEYEAAAARARSSESVAGRLSQAATGGGATKDEVDRALRQAEADGASAKLASARRRAVENGSRAEDINAARARALAANARRDAARAALEERIVRSPIAGEVLSVKLREGEYYAPAAGEALVIVGDTRQLTARIDVDERDIARVALGATALVRASAFPGTDFGAKVIELGRRMGRKNVRADDPVERNDTKVLEVVLKFDARERLVIGQRVTAWIAARSPQ